MSNAVTKVISQSKTRISQILPPGHDVDKVVLQARLAVHRNPKLQEADPISVLEAVMAAAQLGLEVGRTAHLVPFRGRGGMKCQMIPDYKGLIDLVLRDESVMSLQSYVVYKRDTFAVVMGTNAGITHVPNLTSPERTDADIVAVYAVAEIAKGGAKGTVSEVMTLDEVNAIRAQSKSSGNGPWVTHFAAMARKTVIKRLLKMLPQSPGLGVALEYDNRAESGRSSYSVPGDTEATIAAEMAEAAEDTMERVTEIVAEVVE